MGFRMCREMSHVMRWDLLLRRDEGMDEVNANKS